MVKFRELRNASGKNITNGTTILEVLREILAKADEESKKLHATASTLEERLDAIAARRNPAVRGVIKRVGEDHRVRGVYDTPMQVVDQAQSMAGIPPALANQYFDTLGALMGLEKRMQDDQSSALFASLRNWLVAANIYIIVKTLESPQKRVGVPVNSQRLYSQALEILAK